MLDKPDTCKNCALYNKGTGFSNLSGPKDAAILVVGETLEEEEAKADKFFVGSAGYLLNKAFKYVGIDKDTVQVHNIISCHPPGNWLKKSPWEHSAIFNCAQYINKTLENGNYKVIIATGITAAKQLLGLYGKKGVTIYDLHGAPAKDKTGKFWVIPTFHPNYILQGHWNLFGTFCFDLLRALEISRDGFSGDKARLIIDPGQARFSNWVKYVIGLANKSVDGIWLGVDIETPYKLKNAKEENSNIGINPIDTIHRINFACDENLAYTVPFDEYHLKDIKFLLAHTKIKKSFWNMNFDKPNLEAAGVPVLEPAYDMMYGFHLLQSDIRMGLGFVAPFYSMYGPWKHLADHTVDVNHLAGINKDNYKLYSAVDGIQTIRCTNGIERDLKEANLWEIFERHVRDLDRFALRPAEKIGLLFNKEKLEKFQEVLELEEKKVANICLKFAPKEIIPWENEWKTSKAAMNELGKLNSGFQEITELQLCYFCPSCNTINVSKAHEKTKKCLGVQLRFEEHKITKWVKEGVFNPNSSKQVLAYIKSQGHKPGKQKKTANETSDVSTLENLRKKHPKDAMYPSLLQMRKITKMKGTYCIGILERLDNNNRTHSSYTHIPSMGRLSAKNPNLTNLVAKDKKEDEDNFGGQFRACVIPSIGCSLLEADYGGIEAVQTGWFSKDPDYIRLAKLSVHSYLTTHLVGKPADLSWSDEEILSYFSEIKKKYFLEYNKAKRIVHGSSYGLTAMGAHLTYPELFPKVMDAKKVQDVFFSVAAKVHDWQNEIIKKADTQGYLGGKDHPFNYRHRFYNVIIYEKISEYKAKFLQDKGIQVVRGKGGIWYHVKNGTDAKRAIAFYPQSTAGGVLKEAMLALFDPESPSYIGDCFYGDTPLRAPIHDSLLLEVPNKKLDFVAERVYNVMKAPIIQQPMDPSWNMGKYLTINVEMEVGKDWATMEKYK